MHQMNIMHQMSLEIFFYTSIESETFHYPGYVIRLQEERHIEARRKSMHKKIWTKKFARNQCPSQLKLTLFTKNIKIFRLHFFE